MNVSDHIETVTMDSVFDRMGAGLGGAPPRLAVPCTPSGLLQFSAECRQRHRLHRVPQRERLQAGVDDQLALRGQVFACRMKAALYFETPFVITTR